MAIVDFIFASRGFCVCLLGWHGHLSEQRNVIRLCEAYATSVVCVCVCEQNLPFLKLKSIENKCNKRDYLPPELNWIECGHTTELKLSQCCGRFPSLLIADSLDVYVRCPISVAQQQHARSIDWLLLLFSLFQFAFWYETGCHWLKGPTILRQRDAHP